MKTLDTSQQLFAYWFF